MYVALALSSLYSPHPHTYPSPLPFPLSQAKQIRKALRYMAEETTMIRQVGGVYYVLRFKSKFDKLTRSLIREYKDTLVGTAPSRYDRYVNADAGSKEELLALIDICQSMHMVMLRGPRRPGRFISSLLNPAELVSTCKGFRMTSNCSHEIAITALSITGLLFSAIAQIPLNVLIAALWSF